MKAEQLLRLYPRAWRERYADEFLETVGHGALRLQQVIDIVAGAIDAWLSTEVRRATASQAPRNAPNQGEPKMLKSMLICGRSELRYTTRDALIGAGVMLSLTFLSLWCGSVARGAGWPAAAEMLTSTGFFVGLIVSMPFWLLKGQPWKAQAVLVGGTVAALLAIGYLAAFI